MPWQEIRLLYEGLLLKSYFYKKFQCLLLKKGDGVVQM
jgi:hypothetical protein